MSGVYVPPAKYRLPDRYSGPRMESFIEGLLEGLRVDIMMPIQMLVDIVVVKCPNHCLEDLLNAVFEAVDRLYEEGLIKKVIKTSDSRLLTEIGLKGRC